MDAGLRRSRASAPHGASGSGLRAHQMAASATRFRLRCSVPVCLRCSASYAETLPRGRAIDAESVQQHRRRIWRLESEDLGQHLLGRDLEPPTVGLRRLLKHFLGRGGHAEAIFSHDVSDRRLLRHGAHRQWGSVGAGPQAQGAQRFAIERLKGLASLLEAHAQHDFDRGFLQQGEQDVIGASSAPLCQCRVRRS
jgi:hypothetical protein